MGIFSRFSDIINSNIVAMLDKAENPEKMIRLMIQEMEDTLVEVKSQTAKIIADKKTSERRINGLDSDITKWQEKAEFAITKNRDDLAKLALEEKAKKVSMREILVEDFNLTEESLAKYKSDILQLEDKLRDAKKRQKAIMLRHKTATSQLNVKGKLDKAETQLSMNRFDTMERRIDQLEGEVEVNEYKNEPSLEEQFSNLENESKIEKELNELKEKVLPNNKVSKGDQ